jgi:prophage DNA circulation protein
MNIKQHKNPWRDRYQPAAFRNAQFYVETDMRVGGRRVAVHEYPKRNTPYAEDMGRKAFRYLVQGYLIGPHYWDQKNRLIAELDKDGPGLLRLPLPYNMADVKVTVASYTAVEGRERGGFCMIEMDFVEYGDPQYRQQISTAGQIEDSAFKLEDQLIGPPTRMSDAKVLKLLQYAEVHKAARAGVPTVTQAITTLQFREEMKL